MKPTIGRMVHYLDDNGKPSAAVIVGLGYTEDIVDLFVFPTSTSPGGVEQNIQMKNDYSSYHVWEWPPRV